MIDTGRPDGAYAPATVAAENRLVAELRRDPDVRPSTILSPSLLPPGLHGRTLAERNSLVDPTGQVAQIRAAGQGDSGTESAEALVHRIRDTYIPDARFPNSDNVILTGAPAFGVDFVHTAYGAFPWLVVAVLILTYLLLLRAFRSVVLPLKAVLLNLLSVSATYGVLVLVFQHGLHSALGLKGTPQIEAWIPIFLFAMLFGLSMDYEVFLLSRIREEWDKRHNNEEAVAYGLEHTGRIITAAALIMIAAFSASLLARFVGLQEFGARPLGGDPARRDDRPRDPRPGADEAAGRLELVPAQAGRADPRSHHPRAPRRGGGRVGTQPPPPPRSAEWATCSARWRTSAAASRVASSAASLTAVTPSLGLPPTMSRKAFLKRSVRRSGRKRCSALACFAGRRSPYQRLAQGELGLPIRAAP